MKKFDTFLICILAIGLGMAIGSYIRINMKIKALEQDLIKKLEPSRN